MILKSKQSTFFSFLILVFVMSCALAADRTWKGIGPAGGDAYEIIPDRSNPNIWYSIVNETLYRSSDNARSWRKIADLPNTIAVYPKDSSLYVVTGTAERIISKSIDHGETFTALGTVPPASTLLKLDQNVPSLMYSKDDDLFRSSDEGKTWEELPIRFDSNSDFYGCKPNEFYLVDIMPSPMRAETLYASLALSRCPIVNHKRVRASLVLESTDKGTTWHLAFARNAEAYKFAFDPAYPDHAFAFNGRQIEILTSSGWSLISKIPCQGTACSTNQFIETIGRPGRFLLQQTFYSHRSYFNRLLVSENGGKTWKVETFQFSGNLRIIRSMNVPIGGLVVGTSYGGIYRRTQNQRWQSANLGIKSKTILNKVLASGNKVFAYQEDYYGILLFKSDDRGEHWKNLFGTLPPGRIKTVAVNPHDGNHLIMASIPDRPYANRRTTNLYVSRDGGQHWKLSLTHFGRGSDSDGITLFDPIRPNVLFVNVGFEIYKSVEFGFNLNLFKTKDMFGMLDLAADVTDPKTLYATDGRKVFKSTDEGLNFKGTGNIPMEDDGDGAVYICQVGTKPGTFLVDNDNMALMISTNAGEKWKHFSQVPAGRSGGNDPPGAGKLISADFEGMHFYAESHGHLFESTNGALNWRRLNHQWPVEKRFKGSVYSSDVAYSNGLLVVATNFGLFKTSTNSN